MKCPLWVINGHKSADWGCPLHPPIADMLRASFPGMAAASANFLAVRPAICALFSGKAESLAHGAEEGLRQRNCATLS